MPRAQAEPGISTPHVLERDAELTALGGAVERVRDGLGGWLLIEGSAGVGKSRLLASARASAEEAGLPVLGARGAARAGVRLRCGAEAVRAADRRRHGGRAPGSRRRGGLSARLVGEDGPEIVAQDGDAAFGALHGLYCLTVNLADRGPLVLVADDAHWADPPSLIPAVMTLVGKASWWMPSWLGRRLPRISIEGEDHFAKQPVAAQGQS